MASPTMALACPIRDALFSRYQRSTNYYNSTLSVLLGTMSVEEASSQVSDLYDHSVAARKAMQAHEQEHGCIAKPHLSGSCFSWSPQRQEGE
jgi:hypothetical protein